jgi:hypothetical protein
MIKAIETKYNGYKFRSRLEARWAVFFDALKIPYEYEYEGFDLDDGCWYLPDFYLPEWKAWIEIKPILPIRFFKDKILHLGEEDGTPNELYKILKLRYDFDKEGRKDDKFYIFCGVPGVPELKFNKSGWKYINGSVGIRPIIVEDILLLDLHAFAMTQGGKNLDIWPYYIKLGRKKDGLTIATCPVLPNIYMSRCYIGDGVLYDSPKLKKAYDKAKQARFGRS